MTPILPTDTEVCAACYCELPANQFSSRSHDHQTRLGGLWCIECLNREQIGLKPIRPTFSVPDGAAHWVNEVYPKDERDRKAWLVLWIIAGFIDNETHPTIRELEKLIKPHITRQRILQLIKKLERTGWLIVNWSPDPFTANTYRINYERTPVINHDPNESTNHRKETATA